MQQDSLEVKSVKDTENLLIMLHGVGSDGYDMLNLVPIIQNYLPNYHFFAPNGVENYDMSSFGRQWFSIKDRGASKIFQSVKKNTPKILDLITQKQEELNLTNANTVLLGFSQGAMIGGYLTLISQNPFKGMISISGRLLPPEEINNRETPFCIIHGKDDEIVESTCSRHMAIYCTNNNIKNELLMIDNLMHSIDGKGIDFAVKFIQNLK